MATGLRQSAFICTLAALSAASAMSSCSRRMNVGAVRGALAADSRASFDLLVALQQLDGGKETDWGRAEQLCRGLRWPRCDRAALQEMQRRSRLPEGARKDPVAAAALAVADLTWAYGSEDAARKMFRAELDRIPDTNGPGRARVLLRFAIIDTNFDGQAALFAQACVADASLCDRERMKAATEREVKARLVAPGNVMPLFFVGHPRLAGPR
jgi:hypothetical protein